MYVPRKDTFRMDRWFMSLSYDRTLDMKRKHPIRCPSIERFFFAREYPLMSSEDKLRCFNSLNYV